MIDRRLAVVTMLLVATGTMPSWSQGTDDPVRSVRALYAPYVRAGATPPDALAALQRLADPALRRAIGRVTACERRDPGSCHPGMDVIIDGQDWELTDLRVTERSRSETETLIEARFRNLGEPRVMAYRFRRLEGRWRLSELSREDGEAWVLSQLLTPRR